jgi:hypothetical protein
MSLREKREFIQSQILETNRLLELTGDHPVMAPALTQRKEVLENELRDLPPPSRQPRTVLFFAGEPVLGSRGIDAQFASSVLGPFLQMVKTQFAAVRHGSVGRRGVLRGESEARLLLTGLPRGSFGLELSQPESGDFLAAEQLSGVLIQLTKVIESAGQNDESFAFALEDVSPRVVPRLKEFFKVVADNKARMRVASGDLECRLEEQSVIQAYERVSATNTREDMVELTGIFRGATLDTWRFDFRNDDGENISGRLADDVSEADAVNMIHQTEKHCKANLRKLTVSTRSGTIHLRYELTALQEIPPLSLPETT